ncbi:unnamed protein product [Peniophora sp. CBMAI 1063]|nr:unnamed protein product [Peniophora sp. CBMAI 1063]
MKRVIIDKLEATYATVSQRRGVYDGENLFYSQHPELAAQYPVTLPSRRQGQPDPRFHVTLARTASDIIQPLRPDEITGNATLDPVSVNLLQLLSQEGARRKSAYWNARRSVFFDGSRTAQLGGGVVLWHGFLQSVKAVQGNLVINVDVASTLMWTPDPLLTVVGRLLEDAGFRHPLGEFHEQHPRWGIIGRTIKNLRIEYTSMGGVVKQRRIRGILPRACTFVFTPKNGPPMTVGQYWQSIIQRPLDDALMGVYLDEEKKIVVPAELCQLTPGQRYIRPLTGAQQTAALRDMTQIPSVRWDNIAQGMRFFDHGNSQYLIHADMQVSDRHIVANGLQVGPPRISYAAGPPVNNADGTTTLPKLHVNVSRGGWEMPREGKFYLPKLITHWAAYDLTQNGDLNKMTRFLEVLWRCCGEKAMGVPEAPAQLFNMAAGFQAHRVDGLSVPPEGWNPKDPYRPLLIFFLSTAGASEIRRTIKYWGEVLRGVPTQCIMIDKLSASPLFGNNIAMKLNAKLGGINCVAGHPRLDALKGNTMIIGADVTHPSPGILNRPSFPAVVGSIDDTFTQYAACMDVQAPRMDMIENLGPLVLYLVKQWTLKHHGHLPEHVIYFRDGISEGEYDGAGRYERDQIQKAWDRAIQEILDLVRKDPKQAKVMQNPTGRKLNLTFIVVEKRHHIRYSPDGPLGKQNVPAGTIVTEAIATRAYENFYIVSQGGLLGTSRPAHCVVLERDPVLSFEMCQDLVYFLSHVCVRTTKSASLPAPVYFADLLCAEALNYINPGHPIFNDDNLTVASGNDFVINLDGWKAAMAFEKRGTWTPGPDFVHPNSRGKLFFL